MRRIQTFATIAAISMLPAATGTGFAQEPTYRSARMIHAFGDEGHDHGPWHAPHPHYEPGALRLHVSSIGSYPYVHDGAYLERDSYGRDAIQASLDAIPLIRVWRP
jgi:hypothetical protein